MSCNHILWVDPEMPCGYCTIKRIRKIIEQECFNDKENNPVVTIENLLNALENKGETSGT